MARGRKTAFLGALLAALAGAGGLISPFSHTSRAAPMEPLNVKIDDEKVDDLFKYKDNFKPKGDSPLDRATYIAPALPPPPTPQNKCTTVHMWDKGGSMSGTYATNQSSMGDCFAHSAAAIATAYIRQHPEKFPKLAKKPLDKPLISPEALYGDLLLAKEKEAKKDPQWKKKLSKITPEEALSATLGRTCGALHFLNQMGACDADAVHEAFSKMLGPGDDFGPPSSTDPIAKHEWLESRYNAWAEKIKKIAMRYKLEEDPSVLVTPQPTAGKTPEPFVSPVPKLSDEQLKQLAPGICAALSSELGLPKSLKLNLDDVLTILNITEQRGVSDAIIAHITAQACSGPPARFPLDPPKIPEACDNFGVESHPLDPSRLALKNASEFQDKLHSLLDRGKKSLPVGIEFCSGILTNSRPKNGYHYIVNRSFGEPCAQSFVVGDQMSDSLSPCQTMDYLNTEESKENFDKDCDFHATVVVGREWNDTTGKCDIILQNSWGDDCDAYEPAGLKCKNGRVWVPEGDLVTNTVRLTPVKQ